MNKSTILPYCIVIRMLWIYPFTVRSLFLSKELWSQNFIRIFNTFCSVFYWEIRLMSCVRRLQRHIHQWDLIKSNLFFWFNWLLKLKILNSENKVNPNEIRIIYYFEDFLSESCLINQTWLRLYVFLFQAIWWIAFTCAT